MVSGRSAIGFRITESNVALGSFSHVCMLAKNVIRKTIANELCSYNPHFFSLSSFKFYFKRKLPGNFFKFIVISSYM